VLIAVCRVTTPKGERSTPKQVGIEEFWQLPIEPVENRERAIALAVSTQHERVDQRAQRDHRLRRFTDPPEFIRSKLQESWVVGASHVVYQAHQQIFIVWRAVEAQAS